MEKKARRSAAASTAKTSQQSGYSVQVVDRIFDILECLNDSETGMTLTELSAALTLAPSTMHRLVNVMIQRGYVELSPESRRYSVGLKILEIRGQSLRRLRLTELARPYLRKLVEITGERAHLAVMWEGEVVYLESIEETPSFGVFIPMGKRSPIHSTALGKAILAFHSESDVRKLLSSRGMRRFTKRTIVRVEDFLGELERVRELGFAVDNEEGREGVRCLAAPVFDHRGEAIAAVSLSGNAAQILPAKDHEHCRLVLEAAAEVSKRLGFYPQSQNQRAV
jgi:DNA-binding IclR family transcriptional regulator